MNAMPSTTTGTAIDMKSIQPIIDEILPEILDLRHALHAHPELGYEEHETAGRILDSLKSLPNLTIQSGIAGTGIVAVLNADKPGPCVALRAELDALPIQEESELPHKSQVPGKMHACGHDGHMSCLVGAARVLSRVADTLPGKVKFIWQPAEEGGAGGAAMREAGVLDDPPVDAIFALHGWPYLELGQVGLCVGATMASTDPWHVTVTGVGTHAAYPHKGIDPIVVGAQIVQSLQTIASRNVDPLESVVVTVARFQAGTATNIIPGKAALSGTIRTLNPQVREHVLARFREIVTQTAALHGARAEIEFSKGYPVVMNHTDAVDLVAGAASSALGESSVRRDEPPCMGGEDFAFYAERVPAAFWRLGVRNRDAADQPLLHQPTYNFPDEAVAIGITMHCEIARRALMNPEWKQARG